MTETPGRGLGARLDRLAERARKKSEQYEAQRVEASARYEARREHIRAEANDKKQRARQEYEVRKAAVAAGKPSWPGPDCLYPLATPLNAKEVQTFHRHMGNGAAPWLVLSPGLGAMAAFEDRIVIVKVGLMAGLMAGAPFGGREVTFPLAEITGIEYNATLGTGWLEILTPSHPRTANQDWRRNTNAKGRDATANSAWALPNTLLMTNGEYRRASNALQLLQQRIVAARNASSRTAGRASRYGSLSSELARLADLHAQGALTADEFRIAKARLMAE